MLEKKVAPRIQQSFKENSTMKLLWVFDHFLDIHMKHQLQKAVKSPLSKHIKCQSSSNLFMER